MRLEDVQAMLVLGKINPDELPAVASEALGSGLDSPSLRALSILAGGDSQGIQQVFGNCLRELGVRELSEVEARRWLARHYAEQILSGTLRPYEGARRIWWEVWDECRQLEEFAVFAGLASEYEDDQDPQHRDQYLQEIVYEAKRVVVGEPKASR